MKKPAAWRAYAEKKDLDRLEKMRAKIDMDRKAYATEFDRVKNYSTQRLRRAKPDDGPRVQTIRKDK